MAGKRVIAVLAAVLLIAGAVVARRMLDDDESSTDRPSSARVACVIDLRSVCEQLDVGQVSITIEPYGTTLDAIGAGTGPDAWITFAPLDRLAAGPDGSATFGDSTALGSARLALAVRAERATPLAAACGGTVAWRCIGENAGRSWESLGGQTTWGSLTPGLDDPTTRATGLLTLGAATASYFGRTDFNAVDIDADDELLGWFSRLTRSVPDFVLDAGSALDPLATGRAVDLAGTSEAELVAIGAAQSSRFTVTYPEPMARADAVLVIAQDGDVPESLTAAATAAFDGAPGWTPTPADPGGVPSAGVLRTLLDLWTSIR